MLPPINLEPIETDDLQQTWISDPATEELQQLRAQRMRSVIDPTTGGRRSASINTLLRTDDGRLVEREPIYACRTCGQQPLSIHAIRACQRCRNITCASCTAIIDDLSYCPACGAEERRSRLWRFLFSIE